MSVSVIKIDKSLLLGPAIDVPVPVNGWIAGGAIRRWFAGKEDLSDVDVFFQNEQAFNDYIVLLAQKGAKPLASHPNAVTYEYQQVRVQCIRVKWYATLDELLDSFDFTVCQFAWNGTEFFATPEATISVLRNHLGAHNISQNFAVDSLRRAFKYCKKGYHPCNGTIQKIAHSLRTLTEQQVNDAIEISPNGGKRTVRID